MATCKYCGVLIRWARGEDGAHLAFDRFRAQEGDPRAYHEVYKTRRGQWHAFEVPPGEGTHILHWMTCKPVEEEDAASLPTQGDLL